MEEFGNEVVYPTLKQICQVNRQMIDKFGGLFIPPYNLANTNALEYILQIVTLSAFGQFTYSTLEEKATALAYHIITRHVFMDGNKRTGVYVAWEFLNSNGVPLVLDSTIEDLSIAIADGKATQDELLQWIINHSHI